MGRVLDQGYANIWTYPLFLPVVKREGLSGEDTAANLFVQGRQLTGTSHDAVLQEDVLPWSKCPEGDEE